MEKIVRFGEDYHDKFNTQAYLESYLSDLSSEVIMFPLPYIHQFYQSFDSDKKLKILDIGSGPSIVNSISAVPYSSEIVLSEYTESNREALRRWLEKDPKAHDWTLFLRYVVIDIEGGEEKDVALREKKLRSSIKAIVPCDVTKDPLLPTEFMREYDVLSSTLCLDCACKTVDDYNAAVKRFFQLLKPGGKIFIYGLERNTKFSHPAMYKVGNEFFNDIRLSKELITTSLESAGFINIEMVVSEFKTQPLPDDPRWPVIYTAVKQVV